MIPNLVMVKPGIWRGGQPLDTDWQSLFDKGITNVVKLNLESEGTDAGAKALLMNIQRFPIPLGQQLFDTHKANIFAAVAAIQPGTFVHCGSTSRTTSWWARWTNTAGGQDRTGLIIGIFRVMVDGWTKAAAYKEMQDRGFHAIPEVGLSQFWQNQVVDNTASAGDSTP